MTDTAFSLTIETRNTAFQGDDKPLEIARILRRTADRITHGQDSGPIADANGNFVGSFQGA
jgi:hypothetical protein